MLNMKTYLISGTIAATLLASPALAVTCGNNAGGFEAWKSAFAQEAAAKGIGKRSLQALAGAKYATSTISADRNQKSFKLSFNEFMKLRGAPTIVSQGKKLKAQNAKLFSSIEAKYGVPAGPLIAIWGMESGFGRFSGNDNILSAVATLSYDCRRSAFFTENLYALLQLIDRGAIAANAKGAKHGEIGMTQFLPKNVLRYGVDADGGGLDMFRSKADALASTANFLRGHGWRKGGGYQPGEGNFGAIQGWNAAGVYQKAIAEIGRQIDG